MRRLASLDRRRFLRLGAAGAASLAGWPLLSCDGEDLPPYVEPGGWDAGEVLHLLPVCGPDRMRLKVSFRSPQPDARLRVDGRSVPGRQGDRHGRFLTFDVARIAPGTSFDLRLEDPGGGALCDAWPLRTLPAPDASPRELRLLSFTCAGGPEGFRDLRLRPAFQPLAVRRRLLARALSFRPDVAIANGDHVYWDLHSRYGLGMGRSPQAWWRAGLFDEEAPVRGGDNEEVLKAAFGPQIADLYGTLFRSIPTFFLRDDHDYGENDAADESLRTFPPRPFMRELACATQRLYYPELLGADGGFAPRHGAFRYGRLFEALLYDCRGGLTNAADPARRDAASAFVPPAVERWLLARTARSDALHLLHAPSTPILWTAGKWGEWYPDVQDDAGGLSIDVPKPFWPEGWQSQHDRLLAAASARRDRTPLFVSGDLHALAAGTVRRSGALDLSDHPVVSILSGPIGTGAAGWPSTFRGQPARPSLTLDAEEWVEPREHNGFALLDFSPDHMRVRLFGWRPEQGLDAIEGLEPFADLELPRPVVERG